MKGNHSSKANFPVDLLNLTISATVNASKDGSLTAINFDAASPILILSREFTRNPATGLYIQSFMTLDTLVNIRLSEPSQSIIGDCRTSH